MSKLKVSHADMVAITKCQAYIRGYLQMEEFKKMKEWIPVRNKIAEEIYETEVTYVNSLTQVVEKFLIPLRQDSLGPQKLISKENVRMIFSEIEVIANYSNHMLKIFKQRIENWHPNQLIGDVFLRIVDYLKSYSQYVNNYNTAINTLNALKENSHFAAFIRERERRSDGSIDPLENYLITPVQRIPRYSLLLNDLLKHTWKIHPDYENISRAFKRMNEVATEVNEKKRSRENQAKIIQLYNSLVIGKKYEWNKKLLMDQKNRKFIREGTVTEALIKGKLTKFYAFLLNDLILWTKQKKNHYEFVSVNELSGAKAELKSNTDGSSVVHLRTGSGMRVFKGENDEDTSDWCKSLKMAIDPSFETSLEQSIDYSVDEAKKNETKKPKNVYRETSDILLVRPDIDKLKPKKMRTTLKLGDLRFLEENEKRRSIRLEWERKKIEAWQNIDDIMEIMKYQTNDENLLKYYFSLYNIKVDDSYSIIYNSLSSLGIQSETPEFVFLGRKGDGKTSLVSALIGYPLPTIKLNRPLFIHMVNNQKYEKPYLWLRKDFSTKPHIINDIVLDSFDQLEEEFRKRASKNISTHPVHLYFEQATLLNVVFILTPGLSAINWINESKSKKLSAESVTYSIASDTNRYLIFVEECKDKDLMSVASELTSVVDPTFSRSIFVNTKFYFKMRDMWRQQDVFRYLKSNLDNTFYVTLPPYSTIDKDLINEFQNRIFQTFLRDYEYLNNLQFDALNSSSVGIHRLRNYLFTIVSRKFYDSIPSYLNRISNELDKTNHLLADLEKRKINTNSKSLRKIFSDYTYDFIKILQLALSGSTEIESKVFGQNLEDEELSLNIKYWVDSLNQTIELKPKEWNIAYRDSKIFGSAQIMRLFSVFSSIVENMNFTSIQKEEIIASLGSARPLNIGSHFIKAAFDISHSVVERNLVPLVSQLYNLAIQMIKRLGYIAQTVVKNKTYCNRDRSFDNDLVLLSGYLKANFEVLVDELGSTLLEECSGNLGQVLIFDLSRYAADITSDFTEDNHIKIVTHLVDVMCADISKQLVRDVTVKCFDILISKGFHKILTQLQILISGMSDEDIYNLFNTRSFKEKIEREISDLNNMKELTQKSYETIISQLKLDNLSSIPPREDGTKSKIARSAPKKTLVKVVPKKVMPKLTAKVSQSKPNEKIESNDGSRIRELKASLMFKDR